MSIPRRVAALLGCLCLAPACHWVFSHRPGDAAVAVVDVPSDTGPRPDLPCFESLDLNPAALTCAQQATVANPDSDGLLGDRDPWPSTCNRLAFSEDLITTNWWIDFGYPAGATDPVGESCGPMTCGKGEQCRCAPGDRCEDPASRRCIPSLAKVAWSCGKLTLAPGYGLVLTEAAKNLLPADPHYLTELRFSLGAVADPASWAVGFRTHIETQQGRTCELWYHATAVKDYPNGYSPYVGLHTVHQTPQLSTGAWLAANQKLADKDLPAGSYLLQAWGDGSTEHCRLFDEGGRQLAACDRPTNDPGYSLEMKTPGTIRIHAGGRPITIDHLRVFSP